MDIFRPQVGCHLVSFHPHRVSHPRYISNHCDGKEILFSTIKIFHRYFPPSNPSQSSLAGGFSPTDGALRCCWASQDSTQSRQLYSGLLLGTQRLYSKWITLLLGIVRLYTGALNLLFLMAPLLGRDFMDSLSRCSDSLFLTTKMKYHMIDIFCRN